MLATPLASNSRLWRSFAKFGQTKTEQHYCTLLRHKLKRENLQISLKSWRILRKHPSKYPLPSLFPFSFISLILLFFLLFQYRISIESLQCDIRILVEKVDTLKKRPLGNDFKIQTFLNNAENIMDGLRKAIDNELEQLRRRTAEFFCENSSAFKLEECFQMLASFSQQFRTAIDDNRQKDIRRKKSEERKMTRSLNETDSPSFQRSQSF